MKLCVCVDVDGIHNHDYVRGHGGDTMVMEIASDATLPLSAHG